MTREEAIDWLARMKSNTVNHTLDMPLWWNEPLAEALEMAIKALETVEEFEKAQIITGGRLNGKTYAYKCGLEDGRRKALEQEPKQGHWIVVDDCGDNLICECSECKDEVWFKDASRMWNYCSSCGARMKGVEE